MDAADISQLNDSELPKNLHSLTGEQLAAVCAAFGIAGEEKDGKAALIKRLTLSRYKGREEEVGILALGDESSKRARVKDKAKEEEEEAEEEEEEEEEEEDD